MEVDLEAAKQPPPEASIGEPSNKGIELAPVKKFVGEPSTDEATQIPRKDTVWAEDEVEVHRPKYGPYCCQLHTRQ